MMSLLGPFKDGICWFSFSFELILSYLQKEMLLCSAAADVFRSGVATFRIMYASTHRHPIVQKFHILCLTIMKSNNSSTSCLPRGKMYGLCKKVKLNQQSGSENL